MEKIVERIAVALEKIAASVEKREARSKPVKTEKLFPQEAVLDALYARWPKKQGKSAGYRRLQASLKTDEDLHLFGQALDHAVATFQQEGRDIKYYPMFSTFVSSWSDYLPDDVVAAQASPESEEELLELFSRRATSEP